MIDVVLNAMTWDVNPDIITDPIRVRWYGVMFASGFLLAYPFIKRIFNHENVSIETLDKMVLYAMVATVLGARFGHVFFYGPYYTPDGTGYFDDPKTIFYVWEGGLASHGGAIGLIIAMWLFAKYVTKRSILWGLDRLVIGTALAGCFIRLGNLFNSEIAGKITDSGWGWHFPRYINPEGSEYHGWSDATLSQHLGETVYRYPTQIIEASAYLAIFGILMYMYWRKNAGKIHGMLFGAFLVLVFGVRILVEFIKENQADSDIGSSLNMGQKLSIPLVLAGIFFLYAGYKKWFGTTDDHKGDPNPEPSSSS